MRKNCLIVLDSFEYKQREKELLGALFDIVNPTFYYSKYENSLTELFQKTKIVGGFFTHVTYWIMSFYYAWKLFGKDFSKFEYLVFINPIVGIFYCLLARILHIERKISIGGFLFESKANKLYFNSRKIFVNFWVTSKSVWIRHRSSLV